MVFVIKPEGTCVGGGEEGPVGWGDWGLLRGGAVQCLHLFNIQQAFAEYVLFSFCVVSIQRFKKPAFPLGVF